MDNIPNIEEINEALALTNNDDDDDESDVDVDVETSKSIIEENQTTNILGQEIFNIPPIIENNNDSTSSDSGSGSSSTSCTPPYYVSAITPRSKFKIQMFQKGSILKNDKDEEIIIPSNQVKHVVIFPKREDCIKSLKRCKDKKSTFVIPGSMVLIVLKEEVEEEEEHNNNSITFRQKKLQQICFQLPQHFSYNNDDINIEEENLNDSDIATLIVDRFESTWCDIFKTSFELKEVFRVYNPKVHKVHDRFHFQSDQGDSNTSLMQGGMPFVRCYSGEYRTCSNVV